MFVGEKIEIHSESTNKNYKATVVDVREDMFYFIHFKGNDTSYDSYFPLDDPYFVNPPQYTNVGAWLKRKWG